MSTDDGQGYQLYIELIVTSGEPDELAAAGFDWLTLGLRARLAGEPWTGAPGAGGGPCEAKAARPGDDRCWDGLAVPRGSFFTADHWGEELETRPAGPEALPWLLGELRSRPVQTSLHVGDETLRVDFDDDLGEFVKLSWELDEAAFRQAGSRSAADAVLGTLWCLVNRYRPAFGHVAYGNMGGRTELERNLPRVSGIPYQNIPRWREFLRGYSWWSVVPGELVAKLGGTSALRESGAFYEVLDIPGGKGAWLRATDRWGDYGEAAVASVWQVLRDVLIPGTPQPDTVRPGSPPNRMTVFPHTGPRR